MHEEEYADHIEKNLRFRDLYERDYIDRLQFARDNGCNTALLTGNGEPLANVPFLNFFAACNIRLPSPFRWIELQTSGVLLDDEKLRWLRNTVRVSMISLSISDLFDHAENDQIMGTPEGLRFLLASMCSEIKRYDFGLRLSLNLTKRYEERSPEEVFKRAAELGADQITFRKLYADGDTPEAAWVKENAASEEYIGAIDAYIAQAGRALDVLPFGARRYSVDGISTVLDGDCMSTADSKDAIRYLVLRPNCKLYTRWDDPGSILF
jgi:sulfatase maturation enzyme AslB (radical SAM superfamily)